MAPVIPPDRILGLYKSVCELDVLHDQMPAGKWLPGKIKFRKVIPAIEKMEVSRLLMAIEDPETFVVDLMTDAHGDWPQEAALLRQSFLSVLLRKCFELCMDGGMDTKLAGGAGWNVVWRQVLPVVLRLTPPDELTKAMGEPKDLVSLVRDKVTDKMLLSDDNQLATLFKPVNLPEQKGLVSTALEEHAREGMEATVAAGEAATSVPQAQAWLSAAEAAAAPDSEIREDLEVAPEAVATVGPGRSRSAMWDKVRRAAAAAKGGEGNKPPRMREVVLAAQQASASASSPAAASIESPGDAQVTASAASHTAAPDDTQVVAGSEVESSVEAGAADGGEPLEEKEGGKNKRFAAVSSLISKAATKATGRRKGDGEGAALVPAAAPSAADSLEEGEGGSTAAAAASIEAPDDTQKSKKLISGVSSLAASAARAAMPKGKGKGKSDAAVPAAHSASEPSDQEVLESPRSPSDTDLFT
jgi:hypothetical protein